MSLVSRPKFGRMRSALLVIVCFSCSLQHLQNNVSLRNDAEVASVEDFLALIPSETRSPTQK
jgi:hypothetical protein